MVGVEIIHPDEIPNQPASRDRPLKSPKIPKYFVNTRVPERDRWTLRELLRVAFSRWKVEACFRVAKDELGWDHFECCD